MGTGTESGYGYAAVQLIEGWNRLGIPVWWGDKSCPIAFSFGQPPWYDWQSDSQYKIGYTPWESTRLPKGWAPRMNEMDEIWTTSEFCKEWFIKGGVKVPIRVLHHGLNRTHFPLARRHKKDTFKFLHIGEPATRKGGKLVYDSFNNLFNSSDNVSLTLKGNPTFDIDLPNVKVVRQILTQEQLTELYLEHDAFLYPGNGEGFGFLPFQAAATGMPTATTNWGGSKDYMDLCFPIKVDSLIEADYEPHEGFWAKPSQISLEYWMQSFVDSPEYFFDKSYRKALNMNDKWSWDFFSKLSATWMADALQSNS